MKWFLLILQDHIPTQKGLSLSDLNVLLIGLSFFILATLALGIFLYVLHKRGRKINPLNFLEPENKKILELVGIALLLECLIGSGIAFIAESSLDDHGKVIFLLVLISIFIGLIIAILFKIIVFVYEIKESFREYTSKTDSSLTWEFHEKTIKNLKELAHASFRDDLIFKDLVHERFEDFYSSLYEYSRGHFRFNAESFRIHWRKLIESEEAKFYHSTALVNTPNYWQDGIGTKATTFTIEVSKTKKVRKIFIINDKLWENASIKRWINDQKQQGKNADKDKGLEVYVIKEKNIGKNEDVVYDFGIYGERAVGYQELLEVANNEFRMTYNLYFSQEWIQLTKRRFDRLMEYAPHDTEEYFKEVNAEPKAENVSHEKEGEAHLTAPIDQSPGDGNPKIATDNTVLSDEVVTADANANGDRLPEPTPQ